MCVYSHTMLYGGSSPPMSSGIPSLNTILIKEKVFF